MEKKLTAVEWFAQQLGITSGTTYEQALKMEKQQIIDAWDLGSPAGEIYYNETYGKETHL